MSSELKVTRKKRSTVQTNGEPHIDHRKRPRNRTTQSCLNCHTSKRMCDRKKPCGRCVQLGITGLCVYEVDNPSHRTDNQDDGSRLRQRVAELEGVIRQMKNKPHPRWVRSATNVDLDNWQSGSEASPVDGSDRPQSSSSKSSSSGRSERNLESLEGASGALTLTPSLEPSFAMIKSSGQSSAETSPSSPHSPPTYYSTPSSYGSSSPVLATPPDEFSSCAGVANDHTFTTDFDFTSMFMGYPELLSPYDERVRQTSLHTVTPTSECVPTHQHSASHGGEHCGCLTETSTYQAVLELSLRLRKAADSLKRSPYHRMNSSCMLNQQIAKLDAYAASALGNIQYPMDTSPMPSSPSSRPSSSYSAVAPAFVSHHRSSFSSSLNAAQTHSELHPAGPAQAIQQTMHNYDDSFMAWRGPNTAQ